ncbi:MAG: serpin family protein [Bradymonadaceae bacterium]|nr:serpin family protein [Lujinxingiaceae bacterium]
MLKYRAFALISAAALLSLLITAAGCRTGQAPPDRPGGPTMHADVVSANSALGLDLYGHLGAGNQNLVYSPLSISLALGMSYAGARHETADGIAQAMRSSGGAQVHAHYGALVQSLQVEGEKDTDPTLLLANSMWVQMGLSTGVDFLQTIEQTYRSEMRSVDFVASPEESRQLINSWVEARTRELISDLLPSGIIRPTTRLVLVNALYFKGSWANPFSEERTRTQSFHAPARGPIEVPMMHQQSRLRHARSKAHDVVELPYANSSVTMLVVMPKQGSPVDLLGELTPASLSTLAAGLEAGEVALGLPRFEVRSPIRLNEPLIAMGMALAFDPDQADFSPITRDARLFISEFVHEATITIDERGTEAAAATAAVIGLESAPSKIVEITIDRPFAFFLRDTTTGAVLFMGQVYDPS